MSPIHGLAGFGGGVTSKLLGGGGGGGAESFTFYYHMYGSGMGTLRVYFYDTDAESLIGPLTVYYDNLSGFGPSGQQQLSSGAPWKMATVDISDAVGKTGYVAFRFRPGNDYLSDAALDRMYLTLSDGTEIDLSPDLFQSNQIQNWQSARFQDKTTETFPIDYGGVLINANSYIWLDCIKTNSTARMGQYINGSTPSGNTGPSANASGSTSQYYIYFEASSPNTNYTAWLRTKNQYTI